MKKYLAFVSVLIAFNLAQAQSFKVVKIQGKKAIVEVNDPTLVSVNETYNVGADSFPVSGGGSKVGGRDHGIAVNFSFLSQSSPTASAMTLGGTYLWNFKKWEAGPNLQVSNASAGGVSTNTTTIGGMGFYNFSDNRVGVDKIFAITGGLGIVSGSGSSVTQLSVGPNYRWFMLSSDHCFSFSALYKMAQASGSTVSGFELLGGISTYF